MILISITTPPPSATGRSPNHRSPAQPSSLAQQAQHAQQARTTPTATAALNLARLQADCLEWALQAQQVGGGGLDAGSHGAWVRLESVLVRAWEQLIGPGVV